MHWKVFLRLAQDKFLFSTSQCVLRPWGLLTRGIGLVGVRADRFCRIALSGSDLLQLEILKVSSLAALVCLDLACRHMLWRLPTHYCKLSMTRCRIRLHAEAGVGALSAGRRRRDDHGRPAHSPD